MAYGLASLGFEAGHRVGVDVLAASEGEAAVGTLGLESVERDAGDVVGKTVKLSARSSTVPMPFPRRSSRTAIPM
jgi:hypothetical protein